MNSLEKILTSVLSNPSVQDKIHIGRTYQQLGEANNIPESKEEQQTGIFIGDDCAVIPDQHGDFLLFASEGIIPEFTERHPWFAGYCAVMVNISDVCAMGGVPLAVTDVLWVKDEEEGREIWEGMLAASNAYQVPIVGGHTCYRSIQKHLAVSILGKAEKLIPGNTAKTGDSIIMAIDLDGSYFENYPFWNASTNADPVKLRMLTRALSELAKKGKVNSGKDISMGGIIGTLAMLLHCSNSGAELQINAIPIPENVPMEKWLISFPSYGFLFTVSPDNSKDVITFFKERGIAAAEIGTITTGSEIICSDEQHSFNIPLLTYA